VTDVGLHDVQPTSHNMFAPNGACVLSHRVPRVVLAAKSSRGDRRPVTPPCRRACRSDCDAMVCSALVVVVVVVCAVKRTEYQLLDVSADGFALLLDGATGEMMDSLQIPPVELKENAEGAWPYHWHRTALLSTAVLPLFPPLFLFVTPAGVSLRASQRWRSTRCCWTSWRRATTSS
jgi:hypothetical protein